MKKVNKCDPQPRVVSCGILRELYVSEGLSISHVIVSSETKEHMHRKMEEVYYVERGEGEVIIDNEVVEVRGGDLIAIPKNTWHRIKPYGTMEILVITHPKFDENDVVER